MICAGINATLFWALVADTADFQEWKYKTRTTGVVFSATTCAQKGRHGHRSGFRGFDHLLATFRLPSNQVLRFTASCC